MKRLINFIIAIWFLSAFCFGVVAQEQYKAGGCVVYLTPTQGDDNIEIPEVPGNGQRTSVSKTICWIDFNAGTLDCTPELSGEPISYEIWDATQGCCLFSTDSATEFIEYLSCINFNCMILIRTTNIAYKGYW